MNEKLIQQLRNGKIAVVNDGSLTDLKEILFYAFKSHANTLGKYPYYFYDKEEMDWLCDDTTELIKVSINEFFKTEENETT